MEFSFFALLFLGLGRPAGHLGWRRDAGGNAMRGLKKSKACCAHIAFGKNQFAYTAALHHQYRCDLDCNPQACIATHKPV